MSRLAFFTQNPAQLDRLMRRSALMREKWDSRRGATSYGALTIAKVLQSLTATWQGGTAQPATLATFCDEVAARIGELAWYAHVCGSLNPRTVAALRAVGELYGVDPDRLAEAVRESLAERRS